MKTRAQAVDLQKLTTQARCDLEFLNSLLLSSALSEKSRIAYKVWAKHLVWHLQQRNKLLHHLTFELVTDFFAKYGGHSHSTNTQSRAAVKFFLESLAKCDRLKREAPTWIPPNKGRKTVKKPNSFSDDEIASFLKQLKESKNLKLNGKREYAFFNLLFRLGMRVGELLNLQKSQCLPLDKPKEIRLMGKGGKESIHTLINEDGTFNEAGRVLHDWLDFRERIEKYDDERKRYLRSEAWAKSPYVFPSQKGGPLTYQVVQKRLPLIAKAAGIQRHVSPHVLRHSFAMFLRRKGVPLDTLKELLNHSSITSTMKYVTPLEKEKGEARAKIEEIKI